MPREDLAKVICEDSRRGTRDYNGCVKGRDKDLQYRNSEDREEEYSHLDALPKHEGMKRRLGWNTRSFSENLAPIYGLIVKNEGKNWDKLYSAICRLASPTGSNIQRHVHQHLNDYIATKTQLCVDGSIQVNEYFGGWVDLKDSSSEFYVHPVTRCITRNKSNKKYTKPRAPWHVRRREELNAFSRLTTDHLYIKVLGIWYRYDLEVPVYETSREYDWINKKWIVVNVCTNRDSLKNDLTLQYHRFRTERHSAGRKIAEDETLSDHDIAAVMNLYTGRNARNRKQLSSRELRAMNLENDIK